MELATTSAASKARAYAPSKASVDRERERGCQQHGVADTRESEEPLTGADQQRDKQREEDLVLRNLLQLIVSVVDVRLKERVQLHEQQRDEDAEDNLQ